MTDAEVEIKQLREWKSAILDKCKASDGFIVAILLLHLFGVI